MNEIKRLTMNYSTKDAYNDSEIMGWMEDFDDVYQHLIDFMHEFDESAVDYAKEHPDELRKWDVCYGFQIGAQVMWRAFCNYLITHDDNPKHQAFYREKGHHNSYGLIAASSITEYMIPKEK